ncbi:hypothetical protein MMC25_000391 [Agyrium rufum]|nr:hypothetical protein [Agyrium rufum]
MQVALKRFIDDVIIEVIEAKLILPIYEIFSPVSVITMSDDLVTGIAGESEEDCTQREELRKQLDVFVKGTDTCKRFIGIRLLDTNPEIRFEDTCSAAAMHDLSGFEPDNRSLSDESSDSRSSISEESE